MKKLKFIGKLIECEARKASIYGNPKYYGVFKNDNGEILTGTTATDAACAYCFKNYINKDREVTYHVTKSGNTIIDYIKIID